MSIRKKILLILLVFAAIPMIFVSILGFVNAKRALVSARMEALKSVADFKTKIIEDFFTEQKKHVKVAQQRPNIKKYASMLAGYSGDFNGPDYETIRDELDGALKMYPPVYDYVNVMLANSQGKIVYVLNRHAALKDMNHILKLYGGNGNG